MTGREPDFSRMSRKRKSKTNMILNVMIGLVVVLIIITASIIFTGNKGEQRAVKEQNTVMENDQNNADEQKDSELTLETDDAGEDNVHASPGIEPAQSDTPARPEEQPADSNDQQQPANKPVDEPKEPEDQSGKVTYSKPDDPVISETIIDSAWQPIGTSQTGNHVSLYDGESVDWQEKKQAIAYSTGIPEESLIYWKIKNGGSPQKSVGIVSTKDKSKKYQVHLEWVDGEGWKPVKMDVLNTLEFDY